MTLAKKQLNQLRQNIKRINPEFLSNLTHEFLTPLSIISLNLQIIEKLESAKREEETLANRKYLANIKNQVERLNQVVQDSVELLKIDTFNERVDLREVDILEMLEAIKSSTDLCHHKLLFRSHADSPEVFAKTDQRLLRTSVFRLVNHACMTYHKMIPELVLRESPNYVYIEVFNHDIHLDEEDLNYMFDPFQRTAEMEKIEGMSLALTIIKNRLSLISAQFSIERLEKSGVKYAIRIPRA